MYDSFAAVYDALMADVDYARWAAYYMTLAERSGVHIRAAADCACGTGSFTLALSACGVRVTGLDCSEAMLRIAQQKTRLHGAAIPYVLQDMRRLSLHRPIDAVFSVCDGVNYLLRPRDVQSFFKAAYAALRPGGGLFFDVSTEHKLSRVLGNRLLGGDLDSVSYLWQNHYDARERISQMDLTFFAREPDGRYRRFDEVHRQRAHTREELSRWLSEAGFCGIAFYGDQRLDEPEPSERRMHVAAIRPEREET